jgi:hypothetical protein
MQTHALRTLVPDPVEAYGAMDLGARGEALTVSRLPAWTRDQVPPEMRLVVTTPSGVRLRFKTDSPRVGLNFLATNMVIPPRERQPISFSLEAAGRLQRAVSTKGNTLILDLKDPSDYELVRGPADTIWFDGLDPNETCELWLPHNARIELRGLLVEDGASILAPDPETRPRWIHYGSSISHCTEADQPGEIWPAVAARLGGAALQNLGFGGQCHLDQFVARTIRDSDADLISVKAGINVLNGDSMRERVYRSALHGFLDTVREGKRDQPIMLISPIFCPSGEDHPGPSVLGPDGRFKTIPGSESIRMGCMSLTRIREINADVVEKRRAAGDERVRYLDGLDLFGPADAEDLPDDLHPNAAGYVRMGERFAKHLREMMGAK